MFRLVTQTLKIVEFEADFNGSINCEFVEVKRDKLSDNLDDNFSSR